MSRGDKLMVALIAFVLITFIVGGYRVSSIACEQKAVSFDESRFGIFSGCMVKHKGRWLPLQNIRGFD